jgi:hypothetical protein
VTDVRLFSQGGEISRVHPRADDDGLEVLSEESSRSVLGAAIGTGGYASSISTPRPERQLS